MHGKADEVVDIDLVVLRLPAGARAARTAPCSSERLGGIAVGNPFQHGDEAVLLGPELLDLDLRSRRRFKRRVSDDGFGIGGEAPQLHLAPDAMGAGDDADKDEVPLHVLSRLRERKGTVAKQWGR